MKNVFTLFLILLIISNFTAAQKTSKPATGIKTKSNSIHHTPRKHATHSPTVKRNFTELNNPKKVSDDKPAADNSAINKNNITGIWKGYFVQNSFGFNEDRYRFEVQIAQSQIDALTAVTYSYKTTVFYGKAEAKGIYTKKTNNIILNELKLVDLKISEKSEPCLMTCYLEYNKMGDLQSLTGTYSSRNANDKGDCGNGKVYLEKASNSDFYKEDFVIKREKELKAFEKNPAKKQETSGRAVAKNSARNNAAIKPGAEGNLLEKPEKKTIAQAPETVGIPKEERAPFKVPKPPVSKVLPKPEILKSRDNEVVKTITTHAKEFKIELYDNGEIDGDRISVYHNNELIVSNKTLTDKPISFSIKADENSSVHEFVMVAENLGSIPPNTALMIVTAGSQRYELFVTSTEQKNAVVRIVYQPE